MKSGIRSIETEKQREISKLYGQKELFGTEKSDHCINASGSKLPGDPDFCGSLDTVIEHALRCEKHYRSGGVDGVLIANEFSFPDDLSAIPRH